jgi:hypothetical protein
MSLYEGTNGIQSMDLLGRKMRIQNGACFKAFMKEIESFCLKNMDHRTLGKAVASLSRTALHLKQSAVEMAARSESDPHQWASYTYPALLCFGDVTVAWRLLDMAVIAEKIMAEKGENDYYRGKLLQATYFAGVTLPITESRLETCLRNGREIVDMPEGAF